MLEPFLFLSFYCLTAHAASVVLNFIENCTPDTLSPYWDGIVSKLLVLLQEEMFNRGNYDVGLHRLQLTSNQGNITAKYLLGLWWFHDDSSRSYGINLLNEISGDYPLRPENIPLDMAPDHTLLGSEALATFYGVRWRVGSSFLLLSSGTPFTPEA
ncbi:hypothetical protein MA16_Dca021899 [Dendrobium catenatum]|uniref:Uncharacterized protein n=1 Tax=Dendrobium catenatum TaxID=906689 RepID=A0A2I0WHJ0_9ASPA|nr:hypothetical protein MA16_Dca021899 [Dendrobium catenatum]